MQAVEEENAGGKTANPSCSRNKLLLAATAAAVSVSASAMSNICQNERAGRQAGRRAAAGGHWHGK